MQRNAYVLIGGGFLIALIALIAWQYRSWPLLAPLGSVGSGAATSTLATTTGTQADWQNITITGLWECLPPKSPDSPHTLECAFGVAKDQNDGHYAISTERMSTYPVDVPTGTHVRVEGTLRPPNSTDAGMKYDIDGIIEATSIEKIAGESGIRGTVMLGPTCPVERNPPDPACADKPYATLVAVFKSSDPVHAVALSRSGADGAFSFSLPPGAYTLGAGESNLPRCNHPSVTVKPRAYTTAIIDCDTGIR